MGYKEPLGPGDFLSPDELYDDYPCEECGEVFECFDTCECDKCTPYACIECDTRVSEDDICFLKGDPYCEDCYNKQDDDDEVVPG